MRTECYMGSLVESLCTYKLKIKSPCQAPSFSYHLPQLSYTLSLNFQESNTYLKIKRS